MADLTRRQEQAIAALLVAPTVTTAAAQSGIAERTLRRWLAAPEFQRAYRDASHRLLEDAMRRLQAVTGEAVDALHAALGAESEALRVRAAQLILDLAVKVEADDLAERVRALEVSIGGTKCSG
jgi:hypothetical protein